MWSVVAAVCKIGYINLGPILCEDWSSMHIVLGQGSQIPIPLQQEGVGDNFARVIIGTLHAFYAARLVWPLV